MSAPTLNGRTPHSAAGAVRLGVLISYLRAEEKAILAAARERGLAVAPIFDRDLVLDRLTRVADLN